MTPRGLNTSPHFGDERGQAAVEFASVLFLVLILVFGIIEMGRMALTYIALADGARAGVRYAMVHGTESASPSGFGSTGSVSTQVTNITGFAGLSGVSVTVSYPNHGTGDSGGNMTGDTVQVTASYTYAPVIALSVFTALNLTLTSTSQGIVCY